MNMSQKFRLVFAVVPVALILGTTAQADTNVGGMITTDTHWTAGNGPYIATQSILVTNGATLTIDPGVEIRFDLNRALSVVSGQLVARGTESEPITFTKNSAGDDRWGYISFGNDSIDASFDANGNYLSGSILEHNIVEYAGGTTVNGAINIESASPYLARSTIRNNGTGAIYAKYAEGLRIEGNLIAGNDTGNTGSTSGGVYLYKSNNAIIADNTLVNNHSWYDGGAIYLKYSDNVSVADNSIQNNSAGYHGGGVSLLRTDNVTISNNAITDNASSGTQYGGGGLYDFESDGVSIIGNTISDNTANRGGGVYLHGSANITFADDVISDNEAEVDGGGVSMYSSHSVTFSEDLIANNLGHGIFADRYGSGIILSLNPEHPTAILGNSGYQVWNEMDFLAEADPSGNANIDARNVWWGSTDTATIEAGIFDFFDDASYGVVFFDPYALSESPTLLPGDANNDGMVSADDYGSVQLNFGDIGVAGIPGDANGDGVVSADDYGSVQLNFGAMAGLGGALVPEPATLLLLCIGGLAILRRRRFDGVHHGRKESTNYTDLRRLHR
ncbi:MAG TPA: PEP-CTERM sorting domain-containing protein [Phycisphaerae bacterium]|nr:PEP-CTERM sorting domain-containing protein [Phycisphaerae bacterium]